MLRIFDKLYELGLTDHFVKATVRAFIKNASSKSVNEPSKIYASLIAKEGESGDMEVDGRFGFNGLSIYYTFYAEVGINNNTSGKKKHKGMGKRVSFKGVEEKGNLPILEEWDSDKKSQRINKFIV